MRTELSLKEYQLAATVFTVEGKKLGTITADKADPGKYPGDSYQFYCPECVELGHFTRLIRIKPAKRSRLAKAYNDLNLLTPAKFDLYNRTNSTHKCNHLVRFCEIDGFERYHPRQLKDHGYIFPLTIAGASLYGVNTAKRLQKVLYACMYDAELRDKQFFDVNNEKLSTRQLFDENASDATTPRAVLFRPVARADVRLKNKNAHEILGMHGTSLSCASSEVFDIVKEITERNGGNESAAVLAFATSEIVHDRRLAKGPVRRYRIEHDAQVFDWNHDTDFNKAIANQCKNPFYKKARQLDLNLA